MVTECVVKCYSFILLLLILENVPVSENSEGVQERNKIGACANGKHKEPPIFNCTECEELFCHHCSLNNHEDHNCALMKKTSPEARAKFLAEKKSLKVLLEELIKARDKVHTAILEVEIKILTSMSEIRTKFKELHNILEQREQELVEDATTIAQQKLNSLSQQEKTLSVASGELHSVVDYTEGSEKLSSISTSINTELRKTMQQKIQEHSKSGRSLEPVEEADMAVEITCAEALQQLCLTQANITPDVDPAKCTVDLTASAEVGKPYVGTLTTRLCNGKPNNRKCKVTCHIKYLHNGVTTDCAIDEDESGTYSIHYVPFVHGHHELTVLINGHQVAGSPFPVYAFIHSKQLDKHIITWNGIRTPYGITANSKGEILVSLYEGSTNIVKYDAEGKRVDLVEKSGLVKPRGIACDDEDNIYCIDEDSNKILTCDANGDNLKIHEVELEKNSCGRIALAITDQKLFMAERRVVGFIKVYDKNLQRLPSIEYKKMEVTDISVDIHQNLYVSDIKNLCVHVLTKDGVHLRSIGHDMEELKAPWGLCVRGQYVYVTDRTSHCVFVFTTDGEYVTSFGQKGQKEGDFNWPCYTCADNKVFIYVTDFYNNRIQCFSF